MEGNASELNFGNPSKISEKPRTDLRMHTPSMCLAEKAREFQCVHCPPLRSCSANGLPSALLSGSEPGASSQGAGPSERVGKHRACLQISAAKVGGRVQGSKVEGRSAQQSRLP
uniref:Uncharacterized protein n=1 Tax=Cebus imitator TaxID=2715852 RepID=A0A2K5QDM1_CEBIM